TLSVRPTAAPLVPQSRDPSHGIQASKSSAHTPTPNSIWRHLANQPKEDPCAECSFDPLSRSPEFSHKSVSDTWCHGALRACADVTVSGVVGWSVGVDRVDAASPDGAQG